MTLVFAMLLKGGATVRNFTTGGVPMELGEAATVVSHVLGGSGVERSPRSTDRTDYYVVNPAYRQLIEEFDIPHISFEQQVIETAEYLSIERNMERPSTHDRTSREAAPNKVSQRIRIGLR